MANILPVSDLRNYNEVLKNCHKGEPVYLTKNGRGRFVVMDIEDYERDRAEKKLLMKLQEAEEAVKDGEGWLNLDELKALVGGVRCENEVSFRTDYKYAIWEDYVIIYKVGNKYVEIYRVIQPVSGYYESF